MQTKPTPRRTRVKKHPGIYLSSSGSYEIAFRDSDGKLRFKTTGTNLEEAKAARAAIVTQLHRGERVAPSRVSFGEYAQDWLASLNRRPRTLEAYRYALDRHLLPRFKRRKLGDVNTDDVARMIADMRKADYSGWTVNGALTALSALMRAAERRGLIASNPVRRLERAERPKLGTGEKRILSEEEIGKLLDNAGGFRALVAVGLFAGLRIGEALGLTWADADFAEGFLRVRQQLDRDRTRVELKSDESQRDVVLVPQLARVLREHRMASPHKAETDFVFPAPDGRGRDHRSASRGIERAVERAGLGDGISAHSFRHTYASALIVGLKLDPVNVARQLGHADPAITLRTYSHEFAKARHADEMRDAMEAGFGRLLASS